MIGWNFTQINELETNLCFPTLVAHIYRLYVRQYGLRQELRGSIGAAGGHEMSEVRMLLE